jgi:hypothetical protein
MVKEYIRDNRTIILAVIPSVRNIFWVPKALVIEVGYVGEYIHNCRRKAESLAEFTDEAA